MHLQVSLLLLFCLNIVHGGDGYFSERYQKQSSIKGPHFLPYNVKSQGNVTEDYILDLNSRNSLHFYRHASPVIHKCLTDFDLVNKHCRRTVIPESGKPASYREFLEEFKERRLLEIITSNLR